MELLFVFLIAFIAGLIAHYTLPGRDTHGSMLVPSAGAVVAGIVWVALVWAGWKFDGGWIWVASLIAGGIVSLVLALTIPRTRRTSDSELLQRLSRA